MTMQSIIRKAERRQAVKSNAENINSTAYVNEQGFGQL